MDCGCPWPDVPQPGTGSRPHQAGHMGIRRSPQGARTDLALIKEEPVGGKVVAGSQATSGYNQSESTLRVQRAWGNDLDWDLCSNCWKPLWEVQRP